MTLGYQLTFTREMGPAGMWIGMIAGLSVAAVLMLLRFNKTSRQGGLVPVEARKRL
jgi:MATE family multidrug resistance protein